MKPPVDEDAQARLARILAKIARASARSNPMPRKDNR